MNTNDNPTRINPSVNNTASAGASTGVSSNNTNPTRINPNSFEKEAGASESSGTRINPNTSRSYSQDYPFTRVNPSTSSVTDSNDSYNAFVGMVIANKYKIISRMESNGAEAELYVGRSITHEERETSDSKDKYCIKIYLDASHVRKEVRPVLSTIDHPNIAKIHDWGELNGRFYEVFSLYEGDLLSSIIKKRLFRENEIPSILKQMSDALNELHKKNIVHQDVKPSNFMLITELEKTKVILFDFGISALIDNDGRTHVTIVGKTPDYSAPEALLGMFCWPVSDYYSLGITMLEMLTRRTPFADFDKTRLQARFDAMRDIDIPVLSEFSPLIRHLIVGLLQWEHQDRWSYEQVSAWLLGPGYYEKYVYSWPIVQQRDEKKYRFMGRDDSGKSKLFVFSIPSELNKLVTCMAYNWTDGIDCLEQDGRFERLRKVLDGIANTEEISQICNKSLASTETKEVFFFKQLFRLYPQLSVFPWRGFIAKNYKDLGEKILETLWKKDGEAFASSPFSPERNFSKFSKDTSDKKNTIPFSALEDICSNHLISFYLDSIQEENLAERVMSFEDDIKNNNNTPNHLSYLFYKIGYLLSSSSAVFVNGKKYKNLGEFISYVNGIIIECEKQGDNKAFLLLSKSLIKDGKVDPGFSAWTEHQGYADAIAHLKNTLKVE